MSFVGIISNNDDYEFIKREFLKGHTYTKLELLNINKKNIQNIKNVTFETLVVCDYLKEVEKQYDIINNIIESSKFLLINTDVNLKSLNIKNNRTQLITYGMNQKATVTASSIKEEELLLCLQRNIKNINGEIIEIQEFKKKSKNITNKIVYNLLVVFILEQIYN